MTASLPPLLPLDDALAIIAEFVARPVEAESCAAEAALGRTLAQAVAAPRALPPYASTGVDGYALLPLDEKQTEFRLAGASYAGQPLAGSLAPGTAARIATGAVLPMDADRVVMQEQCRIEGDRLIVQALPTVGINIRPAGADIKAGEDALPAGRRLRPQDLALLGALGVREVAVRRRLRIAVASTGAELAGAGDALAVGQIVDTNGAMLSNLLATDDTDVTLLDALPDDAAATRDALLAAAVDHDLIITTGGVSVGDKDFVVGALRDVGTVHFWRLAIRPGKPAVFGTVSGTPVMGLPGNPVSAFVTFHLLVRPLLAALRGAAVVLPAGFLLPLANDVAKDFPLRSFSRARFVGQGGTLQLAVSEDQSSNLFTSLTRADGLIDLPAEPRLYKSGEMALFRPFTGLLH